LASDFISHDSAPKKNTGSAAAIKFNVSDFTQDHLLFSWQFSCDGAQVNWNQFRSASLPNEGPNGIDPPPRAVA
jgi:hypothetical protein